MDGGMDGWILFYPLAVELMIFVINFPFKCWVLSNILRYLAIVDSLFLNTLWYCKKPAKIMRLTSYSGKTSPFGHQSHISLIGCWPHCRGSRRSYWRFWVYCTKKSGVSVDFAFKLLIKLLLIQTDHKATELINGLYLTHGPPVALI